MKKKLRLYCGLLAVVLVLGTAVTAVSAAGVLYGDINGDGKISITDMLALKSHLLNKEQLTGCYADAANINGDSGISITDFIKIKSHLLNKELIAPAAPNSNT